MWTNIKRIRGLKDFDFFFCCKDADILDRATYYDFIRSDEMIGMIRKPCLMVSSKEDYYLKGEKNRNFEFLNENIFDVEVAGGNHLGYLSGLFATYVSYLYS